MREMDLCLLVAAFALPACGGGQASDNGSGGDAGTYADASTGEDAPACASFQTACNGRCVDLTSDPAHCGSCDHPCPQGAHGTPQCTLSQCTFVCQGTFLDCDRDPSNGCEADTATDPTNCGKCGDVCATTPNAQPACIHSMCGDACDAGWADCDGEIATGCETHVASDPANCGTCFNACPLSGEACLSGTCACPAGWSVCGSACLDTQNDSNNCGQCGHQCTSPTTFCKGGACVCPPRTPDTCSGACVDEQTNPANCGACGVQCTGTMSACSGGVCAAPPVLLFQSSDALEYLTVDSNNVYWVDVAASGNTASVVQLGKSGGSPLTISSGESGAESVLSDNVHLYWTDYYSGTLRSASIGVPGAMTMATMTGAMIAQDPTTLFWVTQTGFQLIPKSGGNVTTFASGGPGVVGSLAVDSKNLYFSSQTQVGSVPLSGGAVTVLATPSHAYDMTIDSTSVYFSDGNNLNVVPIGGGPVKTLTSGASVGADYIEFVVIDGSGGMLYLGAEQSTSPFGSTILRIPIAGGTPARLASLSGPVYGLAVDDTSVYFATGDANGTNTQIWKMAK